MEIYGYFGIFIVNILIGFFLGQIKSNPQILDGIQDKIKDKFKIKTQVGIANRPTAEELRKRGTVDEKGDQAMEATLERTLHKP